MVSDSTAIVKDLPQLNALDLLKEIGWFGKVLEARMQLYFDKECEWQDIHEIPAPEHAFSKSVYAEFLQFYKLSPYERLLLLLALLPHIYPQALDPFFSRNPHTERGYTEFGGLRGTAHSGFLPTGETALFLLGGNDLGRRFKVQQLFEEEHIFKKHNILGVAPPPANEPFFCGQLTINEEYVDFFTGGKLRQPSFSMDFPAKKISSCHDSNDLVLDTHTQSQLDDIILWLEQGQKLLGDWEMKGKIKPGYKALFHGPPGTGKTLTAGLLGTIAQKEVYRIDLSMVVSKYIGETEKNLEKVFAKAENKNWILFFDEADALFGKRTSISDAHDKYANQEIAYLLQRLEDYNGLVILSSNMKNNVDDAFGRRLQAIVHFPVPKAPERLRLWKQAFSSHCSLAEDVQLEKIANKFEIAGGSIINVVQYASLKALRRKENLIRYIDIFEGIQKELRKEGKTI